MPALREAGPDSEVIEGGQLTAREQAVWQAGREAARNTVPALNDMLGRLVTIDTALIGGGVVVAKGDALPFWAAAAVLILLFVSLGTALSGLWPRRVVLDLGDLEQIETFDRDVVHRKADTLTFAGATFALAIAVAIVGVVGRGVMDAIAPATSGAVSPLTQPTDTKR